MRNHRSSLNRIFSIMMVVVLFISLGAPLSAIAQDGNQPTVSSGQLDKPDVVDETLGLVLPNPQASDDTAPRSVDQTAGSTPEITPSIATDADLPAELTSNQLILDDFNRADGAIGPNWTVRDGYCNTSGNAAVCGTTGRATYNGAPGDGNTAEADIAVVGTGLQYTGLLLNYGAGVNNLFIKVQQQAPNPGKFTNAACYIGNNGTGFGLGFFTLTSAFSTAHMKVTRLGSTVNIVFSNIDYGAQPNQVYNCAGAPAPEGTGVGILGLNGIGLIDNFAVTKVTDNVLWDQPLSEINMNAYVDQEFSDMPTYSSFLADDFISDNAWSIDSIYIPGLGWNFFTTLMNASALNWKIYADNQGVPAGNPSGGGSPPVWTLTLPPNNPQVTISTGFTGQPSDTTLSLTTPISLPAGHYWLVFYPTMSFGEFGQFGLQPSDTSFGNIVQFINPGGGFGFGTAWQPWNILSVTLTQHDMAFRIEGNIAEGEWKNINPINGTGRSRPAAAGVAGKLYVFGGEQPDGGRANTVEEYDPAHGTWTTQSGLMPVPVSNICAAAIGSDIYIPGGWTLGSTSSNALQVYHTTSDTWNNITTDPIPVATFGLGCAALSGKLYIFGGSSGTYLNTAYVYNPALAAGARWSSLPSMTYARAFLGGAAVNGKIYAVGGIDALATNFAYVEAFNPADGAWHTVSNLHMARGGPGVYSLGKYLVACGGGWSSYLTTCERYDTSQGYSGVWTYMPSLINGRRTFAYAQLGSALYAVAGYNNTYLTSAERWSIEAFLPLIANASFNKLGFNSQFNGSAAGWYSQGGAWYVGANDLYTEGEVGLWSSAYYDTQFANFDYQARMIRYGSESSANKLIIRGTPDPLSPTRQWYNEYMFEYTRDGYYSIWKAVAGNPAVALQNWTLSPAINMGEAWNTLRVIAGGNSFFFFINDILVWSGTDDSLASGLEGVGMYRPDPSSGDVLRVDWATLWTNGTLQVKDVVSPEQQLLNDAANLNSTGDPSKSP